MLSLKIHLLGNIILYLFTYKNFTNLINFNFYQKKIIKYTFNLFLNYNKSILFNNYNKISKLNILI